MIVDYKNSNIHYTVKGEGEVIILLHGFLETINMWDDLIPVVSKNHKVVCVDLLGHGKTGCLGYIHTMEDMADAVLAVLNELRIENAIFIGHSMGGYVLLALAEKQPQLFKGLCLMNSTFEADDNDRKILRKRAIKMVQHNFENMVRMSFANLFAIESKIKFQDEFNSALQLALKTPVQGYIAAMEGMRIRKDKFNFFKSFNSKKLIVIGKKDSVIDGENLKLLIKDTNIDYEELSEGHMSHIENKPELSYFLKRFIEK